MSAKKVWISKLKGMIRKHPRSYKAFMRRRRSIEYILGTGKGGEAVQARRAKKYGKISRRMKISRKKVMGASRAKKSHVIRHFRPPNTTVASQFKNFRRLNRRPNRRLNIRRRRFKK